MALHHSKPGEVVNLRPLGGDLGNAKTSALVKADELCAGDWVYLGRGAPHSIHGIEDSSLLLTIFFDERAVPNIRDRAKAVARHRFEVREQRNGAQERTMALLT